MELAEDILDALIDAAKTAEFEWDLGAQPQ
jgi:hypothetical protein